MSLKWLEQTEEEYSSGPSIPHPFLSVGRDWAVQFHDGQVAVLLGYRYHYLDRFGGKDELFISLRVTPVLSFPLTDAHQAIVDNWVKDGCLPVKD